MRVRVIPHWLRALGRSVNRGYIVPDQLPPTFPSVVPDLCWGHWWRIHDERYGPWWFASFDDPPHGDDEIGRFDLPRPDGTCYLSENLAGAAAENLREP